MPFMAPPSARSTIAGIQNGDQHFEVAVPDRRKRVDDAALVPQVRI